MARIANENSALRMRCRDIPSFSELNAILRQRITRESAWINGGGGGDVLAEVTANEELRLNRLMCVWIFGLTGNPLPLLSLHVRTLDSGLRSL